MLSRTIGVPAALALVLSLAPAVHAGESDLVRYCRQAYVIGPSHYGYPAPTVYRAPGCSAILVRDSSAKRRAMKRAKAAWEELQAEKRAEEKAWSAMEATADTVFCEGDNGKISECVDQLYKGPMDLDRQGRWVRRDRP